METKGRSSVIRFLMYSLDWLNWLSWLGQRLSWLNLSLFHWRLGVVVTVVSLAILVRKPLLFLLHLL